MKRVYLDYNATTPLDPAVLEIIQATLQNAWGNPSSAYECGKQARSAVENGRNEVARMIGASSKDIIFTSGGTEANNWVINTVVEYFGRHGQENNNRINRVTIANGTRSLPHVITTNIEHDSIKKPLERLSEKAVLDVTIAKVNPEKGHVDVETILNLIRPNTCLVSIMLANNETGVIQPVEQIFQAIDRVNKSRNGLCRIFKHTDAAQAFGKIPVNVKDLMADYMTIVGHKFYGPRIGALYVNNPDVDTPLYPMFYGGGQEQEFRSGTENVGMIAGLGKAAQLVSDNVEKYSKQLRSTRDYLESKLKDTFGDEIRFNSQFPSSSPTLPNTCNVSFTTRGLQGSKILQECTRLEASVGAACHSYGSFKPSAILVASGVSEALATNALRLSVGRETTKEDIDIAVEDIKQAVLKISRNHQMAVEVDTT